MRKISKEQLLKLRDEGKVGGSAVIKALSAQPQKVKEEVEKPKVTPPPPASLEKSKEPKANGTLAKSIDKLAIEVERLGPKNTKWVLNVERGTDKLISRIDVEAV